MQLDNKSGFEQLKNKLFQKIESDLRDLNRDLKKYEEGNSETRKGKWIDILKTRVFWLIKWFIKVIAKDESAVWKALYKSGIKEEYLNSFKQAYNAFILMLKYNNIPIDFDINSYIVHFCNFSFPEKKVKMLAIEKGFSQDKLKDLAEEWNFISETSVKSNL